MPDYDLIVIGAGPGGYIAAIRAAQLGMRVACVEKDAALGGTCLNVGCIPSKALLDSSEHFHAAHGALAAHGVEIEGVRLDLGKMMGRKEKIVTTLTRGIAGLFKKNKVTSLRGTARLAGPNKVQIDGKDPQTLEAAHILLATGSVPIELPGLPFDGKAVISSTEALSLERVPKRMLVVGAGAIGLELGSVWRRLGSEVLVVEFLDRIVPGADRELAAMLQKVLTKQGMQFRLKTTAKGVEKTKSGLEVTLESEGKTGKETCDVVLVAVGRRPYSEGLGLKEAGVETDERGRVKVDAHYRTNVPGIYAIGDLIAGPMLAHKAEEEGVAAVERMAGVAGHVNYDAIPSVVYTWPELAGVGITEDEAERRQLQIRKGSFPFTANARARCLGDTDGAVKVIADAKSDRVLGIHILGPRASDLIAEAAVAMEFSASAEDIARSVHAHPTLAEAIKEAALAVDGRTLNL